MTNIGAFEPIGAAREDVKRTGQVALTHEQRLKSIRWLGEGWFPHEVADSIREQWGYIADLAEIRAIDPSHGANLPPDQFAIWREERDKIDRGEFKYASFGLRMALRANAADKAFRNNKTSQGLAILDKIDELMTLRGTSQPQLNDKEPLEWIAVPPPSEP